MELQGKVIAVLPERSGVSARGEWKSQDYVIEVPGTYPRKMVFSVFGADRIERFKIQLGQEVNVSFDIDAHEYNGRWFNNIRAFDVRQVDPAAAAAAPGVAPMPAGEAFPPANPFDTTTATAANEGDGASDDLPF